MKTKRSREAYVMIDHRNSPGISQEYARAHNIAGPAVGAGQMFESAIAVCSHCGADVILNPNRTREREWCMACDGYICDGCGAAKKAGAACVTLKQKMVEIFDASQRSPVPFLVLPARKESSQ